MLLIQSDLFLPRVSQTPQIQITNMRPSDEQEARKKPMLEDHESLKQQSAMSTAVCFIVLTRKCGTRSGRTLAKAGAETWLARGDRARGSQEHHKQPVGASH